MVWQRCDSLEYPKTWLNFEGKTKCDGSKDKFLVKDLTPEYYISLGYMTNIFLKESAICNALNIIEDEVARAQMQDTWLRIMKSKMSIICVTDAPLPRVAGIHMTLVREYSRENKRGESSDKFSKFSTVVEDLKNEGHLFERFGADHYLGSLGLFVLPEYRGQRIAQHMLQAREIMCRTFDLKGTATVFSTLSAQAAARNAGYKVIATRTKQELNDRQLPLENDMIVMGKEIF